MENRVIRVVQLDAGFTKDRKWSQRFFIWWEGDQTPRGIFIKGHELWFSVDDAIHSVEGLRIGTFSRQMHNGGESGREQQVVLEGVTISHRIW